MKLKPLFDRVLILPTPQKTTSSGLTLPSTTTERPYFGKVVAVGDGTDSDGKHTDMQVKKGDKVLYSKYGGTSVMLEKQEHIVMRQTDILAILEDEN